MKRSKFFKFEIDAYEDIVARLDALGYDIHKSAERTHKGKYAGTTISETFFDPNPFCSWVGEINLDDEMDEGCLRVVALGEVGSKLSGICDFMGLEPLENRR